MTFVDQIEPNTGQANVHPQDDHVVSHDGSQGDDVFNHGGIWTQAIDDFSDWLKSYRGNVDSTVALRRCHLRALAAAHLRRSPWRVSEDDLAAWMAQQAWARRTADSYRSTIRMFYEWARKTKRIKKSPAAELSGGGRVRTIPRVVPEKALTAAMRRANDRDRLILVLGAFAGLRRGEIARIEWADREDGHLRVLGKGDHERWVSGNGVVGRELDAELERRQSGSMGTGFRYPHPDSPYVFPGRGGDKPLSPESIGRAASAALPGAYTTHALRHRFGTITYATSRDLRGVQVLLGHHSPSVTEIYTHMSDPTLDAIVEAIQPPSDD